MIDYEKLKAHPLVLVIAKLEANIIATVEIQKDLLEHVAIDLNCSKELLSKAMRLASEDMRARND